MSLRTAVLDDTGLYWYKANDNLVLEGMEHPVVLDFLADFAIYHQLHTIWFVPGTERSREVIDEPESLMSEGYDVRVRNNEQGIPSFGSIKKLRGTWDEKRIVYFGFPEHDPKWMIDSEDWALADIEDAQQLLDVITSTEAALTPKRVLRGCLEQEPIHLAYSPGYTGMDILKKTMKLYAHIGWMKEADLSMLPQVSEPGGFVWKRPLTDEEKAKKYIHFFDRNGQFTAAATGAELGEGTPDYFPPGSFPPSLMRYIPDLKLPGVWKVSVSGIDFSSKTSLPTFPTGELWAYTPTIDAMIALGYEVEFIEGYQWTTHHRTLQDWAKGLWDGRQQLVHKFGKNSPQDHLSKMIANRGMGWLDLGVVRQENRESELTHRPDWYNMIRSLARYRMVLKLLEMADKGHYPVMIVADNIAYLSDDPNPETALPDLMRRSTELGGFKHDGTYYLKKVLPMLEDCPPNDVRKYVKKLETVHDA